MRLKSQLYSVETKYWLRGKADWKHSWDRQIQDNVRNILKQYTRTAAPAKAVENIVKANKWNP